MRSWVIGRLPRAAARWSGVRASRGETQEFTWNITMSLKECFSSGLFENSRIFQLGANLFEWGVCQRKWYLCDVTPEARVWYLFMTIQQQECWQLAQTAIQIIDTCILRQRAPAQVSEALARLSTILSSRTWQGATRGVISWATKLVADRLHCHFFSLTLASITKFVHACLLGFDKALFLLPGTIWARFLQAGL